LSNTSRLPLGTNTIQATLAGQTTWSTVDIGNRRVRVEALPVRAPAASSNGEVTGSTATGPVIGTLLVAKSLDEVDTTLLLLRTLLISAGLITLAGTLLGGWALPIGYSSPWRRLRRRHVPSRLRLPRGHASAI